MKRLPMKMFSILFVSACALFAQPPAATMTEAEMGAFAAVAQEKRVAEADLRAAQIEVERQKERIGRLNEVAVRLFTQSCSDRGITAPSYEALVKVCEAKDGGIVRRAATAAEKKPEGGAK